MRKSLVRFMLRLVVVALILGGGILTASAHDLPNFPHTEGSVTDCLGSQGCPNVRSSRSDVGCRSASLLATPASAISMAISSSRWAVERSDFGSQLRVQLHAMAKLWTSQPIVVEASIAFAAFPDAGFPPSPVHTELLTSGSPQFAAIPDSGLPPAPAPAPEMLASAEPMELAVAAHSDATFLESSESKVDRFSEILCVPTQPQPSDSKKSAGRSLAKGQYVEDYMPYDFCVRDWRFGQYSYRGLSRVAHLDLNAAEISDESQLAIAVIAKVEPSAETLALGKWLHKLEETQCRVYGELCQLGSLQDFASTVAGVYLDANATYPAIADRVVETLPAVERQPYFTSPLYVVYEQDGKQFLLPAERVKQWSATALLSKQVVVPAVDEPAGESLRTKALALGTQLEDLGSQFLRFWAALDVDGESEGDSSVASRDQSEVR